MRNEKKKQERKGNRLIADQPPFAPLPASGRFHGSHA